MEYEDSPEFADALNRAQQDAQDDVPSIADTNRVYLGDGAYAEYDGYSITLTTSNGIRDMNTVVLEPEVLAEFLRFVTTLQKEKRV